MISILTRFIGHHAALSVVLVDVWDSNCSYGSSASLPPGGERCPSGLEEAERRYTNTDASGACEGNRREAQRPAGTSERVSRVENLQSGRFIFFVQTSVVSYYRSARVYVAQWMQLEFLWNSFVCFYSVSKWKCVFTFIQGKSYVSVKYTGTVDQIWLNVGYLYQDLRKSLVLLSYWWLMLDRFGRC